MSWFGKNEGQRSGNENLVGDLYDPKAFVEHRSKRTLAYIDEVDRGKLVLPACTRTSSDAAHDVRAIWDHTRLEAFRYVAMVPGKNFEPLIAPARQQEMIDVFLRERPHEKTVVEFTGVAVRDFAIAIIAGLNWLNHCSQSTGVPPEQFTRTLRHCRKVVEVAQRWWALEGAEPRCKDMLARRKYPPLMIYLIWSDYTHLAKEITMATMAGSLAGQADGLEQKPVDGPLNVALAKETKARLERAFDPDDLTP